MSDEIIFEHGNSGIAVSTTSVPFAAVYATLIETDLDKIRQIIREEVRKSLREHDERDMEREV